MKKRGFEKAKGWKNKDIHLPVRKTSHSAGYDVKPADDELEIYPNLPKYQCVNKLLRKLNGESRGSIASEIIGELKKPYFYSVFVLNGTEVPFHELKKEELDNTYRYDALRKSLSGF